jgi:hypothetical protein
LPVATASHFEIASLVPLSSLKRLALLNIDGWAESNKKGPKLSPRAFELSRMLITA